MSEQTRDKVFISYSHKDKEWLQKLETYLQPLADSGKIIPWVDADIGPGDLWHEEIIKALETATGSQLAEVLKSLNPAPVIVILSSCHSARQEPNLMPAARALYNENC